MAKGKYNTYKIYQLVYIYQKCLSKDQTVMKVDENVNDLELKVGG